MDSKGLRVGVFDSGVGGLSVLRALRRELPAARLLYVADSGWAPYGERSQVEILARSVRISEFLRQQGADLLVVACNTATAAAVHHLRDTWPDWPIVGVEPGLKPAVRATRNGRVGVLATDATLRSDKFQRLLNAHGHDLQITLQPCPGLARAIESGDPDAPEVLQLVERHCRPLREQGVDTVVLGCTHYPFVAHHIARELGPDVQVIDTAHAVAQRASSLAANLLPHAVSPAVWAAPTAPTMAPEVELWTTGNADTLRTIANGWLAFPTVVRLWPGEEEPTTQLFKR